MPLPPNANDPALISAMHRDARFRALCDRVNREADAYRYSYNFTWMGVPTIQNPEDLMVLQEIIWSTSSDLVIETGVAHGGSLLFYASMMEAMGGDGRVVGIDIDVRPHNMEAITSHRLGERITLIEGSSTDPDVVRRVSEETRGRSSVTVILDSDHTHDHVRGELDAYSPFVSPGSYLVVLDTGIEDMDDDSPGRPWGKGNNPATAVSAFLETTQQFAVDGSIEEKLLLTCAPGGFLRRVVP